MPEPVNINIGGNVSGNIIVGDNNLVVNTNHGTIIYKQASAQVKPREFITQPPRSPRDFVNRTTELQKLETWFSTNDVVILYGPDGMGKSALIRQAANSPVAKSMAGGVIHLEPIDADGTTLGPNDIVQKIFDTLFESDPHLKVEASVARTYLSNTSPLLLLDELPLSQPLLHSLPDLFPHGSILIAADVPIPGEYQRLKLGPLPRHEALVLLSTRAGIEITPENQQVLDALCGQLSDISLALVITGNLLRETGLTPEKAVETLRGRPQGTLQTVNSTLNEASKDAQPVLDKVFELAFSQLSPEEKKILSAAALTPGISMSPEWLTTILNGVDGSVFIERLKSLELLFANSPRLRIQPGFRQAAQKSAREYINENELYTRLVAFLSANTADPVFVSDELGNFMGAATWAARHAEWNAVIQLIRGIDAHLTLNGFWDAWQTGLSLVRDAAVSSGQKAAEGWVLHQLGTRMLALGDKNSALGLLNQALHIRQGLGDTVGAAFTQHNLDLLTLPTAQQFRPKTHISGWLISAVIIGVILTGILILIILAGLLLPYIQPPSTPQTGITSIATTHLIDNGPTPSPTPTITPTLTPPPSPTLIGNSVGIAFQVQPDLLSEGVYRLDEFRFDSLEPVQIKLDLSSAQQPAWSPDGGKLAFAGRNGNNLQIYVVNADGSNITQITNEDGFSLHPDWSPDGKYISYSHANPNLQQAIEIANSDGSKFDDGSSFRSLATSELLSNYDYPEWSPDGINILFQATKRSTTEIFYQNAWDNKAEPLQVTNSDNAKIQNIQPSWSPDGKQIAFSSNRSGSWNIYIIGVDGNNEKALTNVTYNILMPAWSPDGKLIAVSENTGNSSQIFILSAVDGSVVKQITNMPGNPGEADWNPGIFPKP